MHIPKKWHPEDNKHNIKKQREKTDYLSANFNDWKLQKKRKKKNKQQR